MRPLLLALCAAALALPASAIAGGWATVELSSTPTALQPGDTWDVELTLLQHGRTPLDGIVPKVITIGPGGGKTFPASPTGRPGVYRASVVFDAPGRWTYEVDDDFSQTHSYPPVLVGGPAPKPVAPQTAGTSEDGPPWAPIGAGLAVGLLVAAGVRWRRV
jgi:hypothetical protein